MENYRPTGLFPTPVFSDIIEKVILNETHNTINKIYCNNHK